MPTSNYEIPRYGSDAGRLHGWLLEAKQEGAAWLATQRNAQTWASAVALMDEQDPATESSSVSNTTYPKAKRIGRELVASLSSFRHAGEYKVLWDNSLYDMARVLTDLDTNWENTTQPQTAHRQWLQNGVIKGTGYIYDAWDSTFWGAGKGDIRSTNIDPANVTFMQLPNDHDIQRAYMVLIRFEYPINLAKRMFAQTNPGFAASLVPDQDTPSWIEKGLQKVQQFLSPALRVAGRTGQTSKGSFPTVDIYYAYTLDASLNEGFLPVRLGQPGTNWTYEVPVLGGEVATGIPNPATGNEWTKPAKWEDCQMFPNRRLTIFSNTGVASDDTSPWWHGKVPLSRVMFNDLPWNALGGSLISDIRTMGEGVGSLMRIMEDSAAARMDPPALYDDTTVSASWAQNVNPRKAGVRAAAPLSQGVPIQYPFPPAYYDVPQWIPQFMETQEGRMDYITGVRDLVAMAKAKQIPGADTLEKLMEMAGPIVQDMVSALELPLAFRGEIRKANYFQFYNSARVIRTVGPDDFNPEEWPYLPEHLEKYLEKPYVQDRLRIYGQDGARSIAENGTAPFNPLMFLGGQQNLQPYQIKRELKRLMSEFRYEVSESGVNEMNRMTTKLFYLQLMKEGFPISWWTFAKIARIPNFGPPPQGTNTEMERWVAQQHMKIDLQVDLQQELAQGMGGMPGAGGPAADGAGEPQPIPSLGEEHRGRPQSYARAPRMVQKDGGTRTSITTAK